MSLSKRCCAASGQGSLRVRTPPASLLRRCPDPPPTDLHARATQYLNQLRASPDAWKFCLERFFSTTFIEVKVRRIGPPPLLTAPISSTASRRCRRSSPRGARPRSAPCLTLRSYDHLSPEVQAQLRTGLFSWLANYLVANPNESLRTLPPPRAPPPQPPPYPPPPQPSRTSTRRRW